MSEYIYYNDFRLGNKTLSYFNGTIINTEADKKRQNLLPEVEHITDKDSSNNGERYIRSRYQPRIIDISVIFNGDTDLDELRAWLGNNKLQTFSWEDDFISKEIDVIYNRGFGMEAYYGKYFYGEVELSFIAHDPLWRIKNEKEKIITNPVVGTEYYFKNKGNIDSEPIIQITPNGIQSTIVFKWNSLTITLQNIDSDIYIDSSGQVYSYVNGVKIPQMLKYFSNENYDMPILIPFTKNIFTLISGSVNQLKVTLNSRIL